jgi:hypothetical protein
MHRAKMVTELQLLLLLVFVEMFFVFKLLFQQWIARGYIWNEDILCNINYSFLSGGPLWLRRFRIINLQKRRLLGSLMAIHSSLGIITVSAIQKATKWRLNDLLLA